MNAFFATAAAALLTIAVAIAGCAPTTGVAGVAAGLEAQRAKIRVLKVGLKVYRVTKLTDKEARELVDRVKAAHARPAEPSYPHLTLEAREFGVLINAYRLTKGLGRLEFDEQLAVDGETNNARGGRHRYMGSASGQCWASVTDMSDAFQMWQTSPGHNRLMLGRSFTKFGIASGPGNHCTLNLK